MGKTKKADISATKNKIPLEQDIIDAKFAKAKNRFKIRKRKDEEEQYVDSNLTKKILSAAREQQQELQGDLAASTPSGSRVIKQWLDDVGSDASDDDDDSDIETNKSNVEANAFYEDIQINEEDEMAIEMFMSKNPLPSRTLADIIMERITEKHTALETQFSDGGSCILQDVPPRVQAMYENVGKVLKQYRSGKIPKPFKMISLMRNWQQLLHYTDPPSWSAAAMYQATRLFTSNLKDKQAQVFFKLVLLPRIRDDLAEYKRLNFHLYEALKKALYKPAAFMKGIVLPLVESGCCTLREAIIVGSIVAKYSIPLEVSAAAMIKIAQMDYSGANSIFLRILLDKKYALPVTVVDELVHHFLRFLLDKREMPVLWHQALLTLVQLYKNHIAPDQMENLFLLVKNHNHPSITPPLVRELLQGKDREVEYAQLDMDFD